MKMNEHIELDVTDFRRYPDAHIEYISFNPSGVICHYEKDGQHLSFGAGTVKNMVAQWNGRMI